MAGSQDYARDPRNENVLVWVNGDLVPRAEAKVSIFDAGFTMGDGVWEGLRLHRGRLLFLEAHLDRLCAGAQAIRFDPPLDRAAIEAALRATLAANAMTDGAHLRLMVTRGLKTDVNQDPRNALGVPTVVITAEYKAAPSRPAGWGLNLHTASIRCTPVPDSRSSSATFASVGTGSSFCSPSLGPTSRTEIRSGSSQLMLCLPARLQTKARSRCVSPLARRPRLAHAFRLTGRGS